MKIILLLTSVLSSSFASTDADLLKKLIERREEIKTWAPECKNGSYSEYTDHCNQHDVTLFAGLGCLAATLAKDEVTANKRCSDVENAQGSNGRWWRGPIRVDDNIKNSFSRDMARGVHAYLVAKSVLSDNEIQKTQTKEKAQNWLNWISSDEANNKLCTKFTKNRCNITIGARNLFYNSFSSIGALDEIKSKIGKKIKRSKWYLKTLFFLETKLSQKGYARHLKSASALIYRVINMKKNDRRIQKINHKVSKYLYKKDKKNALLDFMANGITNGSTRKLFSSCPSTMPSPSVAKRDFQWQRTTSARTTAISDGHDCIYLINLMVAKINGSLFW